MKNEEIESMNIGIHPATLAAAGKDTVKSTAVAEWGVLFGVPIGNLL